MTKYPKPNIRLHSHNNLHNSRSLPINTCTQKSFLEAKKSHGTRNEKDLATILERINMKTAKTLTTPQKQMRKS